MFRSFGLILFLFCAGIVSFSATRAHAQLINPPGAETALTIVLSPEHPAPGDTVTLVLTSTLHDLSKSTITWRANGALIAQGEGVTNATVTAGDIGTETDISVEATSEAGDASAAASIIPTRIDVLWEADSFVPPFYRGRALPSAGSRVKLMAVAFIPNGSGGYLPEDKIVYTWRKNGDIVLSGRGKSSVTIPGPVLFGTDTVTVQTVSLSKNVSGEGRVRIPSIEPVLSLYTNHPLFGVTYHRALGPTTFVAESEMSFAAMPYFAPSSAANDPSLNYVWRVNRTLVDADTGGANEVTIDAAKSPGLAQLQLGVSHQKNLYMDVEGSWQITFTREGSGSPIPGDPFRPQQ